MTHLYSTQAYADAFAELGIVAKIECLNIWVQIRNIPGTDEKDAIGLYPFSLPTKPQNPSYLKQELDEMGIVSLVLITAPFLEETEWLSTCFDFARPFKTHYSVEGPADTRGFVKKVRYDVRKSLRNCEVHKIALSDYLPEWAILYDHLIEKHDLQEAHRFSSKYFEALAGMGEITTFGAFVDDSLVSAYIWVEDENWITGHLAATDTIGYKVGASHAIFDYMTRYYEGYNINLGGAPDAPKQGANLGLFKKRFSNGSRKSWICGIVANQQLYDDLCERSDNKNPSYFPAYRG